MRRGLSVIEVLVAVLLGLILLVIAWSSFSSSSRVLTRGQNKMTATTQAELVFRHLENDLHTLTALPTATGSTLALARVAADTTGKPVPMTVSWTFKAGPDGKDSYVERATSGGSAPGRPTRFCVGALDKVQIAALDEPGHPGLTVRIEMRGVHDATAAVFQETFFYQNQVPDPNWIPID